MRSDMAQVIIERPRFGSSLPAQKKGYCKWQQSQPVDELPLHEPMLGRWRGMQRRLNENLAPLRRFLYSRIGRPWNAVHQELCEFVSFENAVQKHILAHLDQYVERQVDCLDGRLVTRDGWLRRRTLQVGELYVCPETGLLRIVKASRQEPAIRQLREADGSPERLLLARGHTWYEVRLRPLPEDGTPRWDVWLNRNVSFHHCDLCLQTYDIKGFAISVTGAGPQDVRRLSKYHREAQRQKQRYWRTVPPVRCAD